MNPEEATSSAMLGYLVLALILAAILARFYYRKKIAKKRSLGNVGYWESSPWAEDLTTFSNRSPEELEECRDRREWGVLYPAYTCPYCHRKGYIRMKSVKRTGLIGSAHTAGLNFTGGWFLLGIGLTRKEQAVQVHCGFCGSTWDEDAPSSFSF